MDKSENYLIKFNGTNYSSWAFQFQIYLKGKEFRGQVDRTDPIPLEDVKAISKWETKDAQIMTWILGQLSHNTFSISDLIKWQKECRTA